MLCIDQRKLQRKGWVLLGAGLLAACAATPPAAPPPVSAVVRPAPLKPARPLTAPAPTNGLPAPGPVRNWDEVQRQAARRIVAANPSISYMGEPPDPLLAVPVLEVELNADGSIRRIDVFRQPRQATDTVQVAIDAVRRAAPFGDVSRLPKPWKFVETFLFNDERKFKPRSLNP